MALPTRELAFRTRVAKAPPPPLPRKANTARDLLESFPPELQNRLYEVCLVADKPIRLALVEDDYGKRAAILNHWEVEPPIVNLLATCKRVRSQATAYLYSDNTFSFVNDQRALVFFVTKLKKAAIFLRTIHVEAPLPFDMFTHAMYSLRTHAVRLTKVEVTVTNRWKMGGEDEMAKAVVPWMKNCILHRQDAGEVVMWDILDILSFVPLQRETFETEADANTRIEALDFDRSVKYKLRKLIQVQQVDWKGPNDPRA